MGTSIGWDGVREKSEEKTPTYAPHKWGTPGLPRY